MAHQRYLHHSDKTDRSPPRGGFQLTTTPEIPDDLIASATLYWGDDGKRWCDALPSQIERYLERWRCEVEVALRGASTAYVARVRREDGSPAVLKIAYPEIRGELAALRAYGKSNTVEVYEGDTCALLLEWCEPGWSLRDVASTDRAFEVTIGLMRELWEIEPVTGIGTLAQQCRRYVRFGQETLAERPDLVCSEYARGLAILETLSRVQGPEVFLHGDLHPGNILKSLRRPWLVIDPKPLRGERAYETIPLILEAGREPPGHLDEKQIATRVNTVAASLGLSPERIAQWGAARSCDWSLFCHRANQQGDAERAKSHLRSFLGVLDAVRNVSSRTFGAVTDPKGHSTQ